MKTKEFTKPAQLHSAPIRGNDEESTNAGKTTVTILFAFVFLSIVMGLSYLFIAGAQ